MSNGLLRFTGEVKVISEDAMLMNIDGVTGWIPFSLIEWWQEPVVGKEIDIDMPEWFANKKGFI